MSTEMLNIAQQALDQINQEIAETLEDLDYRANPIDTTRGFGLLPESVLINNSYVVRNKLAVLVQLGNRQHQLQSVINNLTNNS